MSEAVPFAMPSLGADMDQGRITEWLVRPGDHVDRGQIVVVVQTDKSDIEVEVFEPATVTELLVAEGEVVPVGTPIARMTPDRRAARPVAEPAPAEPLQPAATAPVTTAPTPMEQTPTEPVLAPTPPIATPPGRVSSPILRHLADELHVDAAHLHGTGPGGRVGRDDIVRAAQPRRRITPRARRLMAERGVAPEHFDGFDLVTGADVLAAPTPAEITPAPAATPESRQEAMRRHIAELMTRSWREIPHYHVAQRLDLTVAVTRLTATNETRPLADRIVPAALLLCAAARAAAKVPECNGWWHDDRFERSATVDLGLVLSLRGGGIIVPTIRAADGLSPLAMMRQMTELVQRARQGRLRASDMGEASLTVTSLGDRGADAVTGVIHPPQVALVGLGAVRDDVWPGPDGPTVRPTVQATLAGDHRATDGLAGSRFLAQMQAQLDGAIAAELDAAPPDTSAGQEVS